MTTSTVTTDLQSILGCVYVGGRTRRATLFRDGDVVYGDGNLRAAYGTRTARTFVPSNTTLEEAHAEALDATDAPDAPDAPDVTPLDEAVTAVTAVRELATVGAAVLDTQKRDDAWTALTVLIDLAQVTSNVKARMAREAFVIFSAGR